MAVVPQRLVCWCLGVSDISRGLWSTPGRASFCPVWLTPVAAVARSPGRQRCHSRRGRALRVCRHARPSTAVATIRRHPARYGDRPRRRRHRLRWQQRLWRRRRKSGGGSAGGDCGGCGGGDSGMAHPSRHPPCHQVTPSGIDARRGTLKRRLGAWGGRKRHDAHWLWTGRTPPALTEVS